MVFRKLGGIIVVDFARQLTDLVHRLRKLHLPLLLPSFIPSMKQGPRNTLLSLYRWPANLSLPRPPWLALVQKRRHAFLSIAAQSVVGHHLGGTLIRRRLVEGQLIVERRLAQPHRQWARRQD